MNGDRLYVALSFEPFLYYICLGDSHAGHVELKAYSPPAFVKYKCFHLCILPLKKSRKRLFVD